VNPVNLFRTYLLSDGLIVKDWTSALWNKIKKLEKSRELVYAGFNG